MSEQENSDNKMSSDEQRSVRNAIFETQQAVAGSGKAGEPAPISREQYAKKELGLDIPVNAVPLPSAGKIYGQGSSLHNATKLEYRSMTAREEDILMSRAYIKKGTVITELIKSCLIDNSVNVNSMISGDRNALMIAIRASGYGASYKPQYTCPACETMNTLDIDLSALPIKPLELTPAEPFENLFSFTLPRTNKTVKFRFLTGDVEEKLLKTMEIKKKKGIQNENLVTTRLLSTIAEIDGVDDKTQISKFIQYMPAQDSLALREYIDQNEPGVDMSVEFACQNCEHVSDISLPMGPSFFWPHARG